MDDVYEPRYTCAVSASSNNENFLANAPADGFILEIMIKNKYENFYYSSVQDLWVFHNITTGPRQLCAIFILPRELLLLESASWENISVMLQLANIPSSAHVIVIPKIKEFAVDMASDPSHAAPRLLPISVEITKWSCVDITPELLQREENSSDTYTDLDDDELVEELANMTMELNEPRVNPADRNALVELLNTVTVQAADDGDEVGSCTICLETFRVGSQATEMPCKHLFHGECILQWLETSNMCPLCRFALPAAPRN